MASKSNRVKKTNDKPSAEDVKKAAEELKVDEIKPDDRLRARVRTDPRDRRLR
jgi:hypothetical protein